MRNVGAAGMAGHRRHDPPARARPVAGNRAGERMHRAPPCAAAVSAEPVAAPAPAPVAAVVAEVAAPAVAEPVAAPVAAVVAAPVVAPKPVFALPTAELDQLAQSSGLQWVGTSPERAAAVQAAIAAEPVAVHVPRVRPPVAPVQAEPLVMVETKRDLGKMDLPF